MKINKILNFDFRFPLAEKEREQAKKGMETIDITKETPVPSTEKGRNITSFDKEYSSAKKFIQEIINPALKKVGIKRMMSNFSEDYPVKTLVSSDSDVISRMAADVLKDEANAQRCYDLFFVLFGEEYDRKLAVYAERKGKTIEDLSDAEHREAAHDFTVQMGSTGFSEILRAQKAVDIFSVTKDAPAFEDFNAKKVDGNFDLINFLRKYYHSRTKLGETLNIEDVEKEISSSANRSVEDDFTTNEFFEQLSKEERTLLRLKAEGYSEAEIAKQLGYKSQGTISKKLKKTEKKIKEYLG